MARYRKKPVIVNAEQWKGTIESLCILEDFMGDGPQADFKQDPPPVFIDTLEGRMRGDVGDFIIKGISGEFYPCKPDIFHNSYELVEETK